MAVKQLPRLDKPYTGVYTYFPNTVEMKVENGERHQDEGPSGSDFTNCSFVLRGQKRGLKIPANAMRCYETAAAYEITRQMKK